MDKRPPAIDDIRRLRIPSDVQIARDGTWLVYCERAVDGKMDQTVVGLRCARAGGAPEVLTCGPYCDSKPRISPDGRWIAFTRTHVRPECNDAPAELCVISAFPEAAPAARGLDDQPRPGPRVLVRERGAFSDISWSPASDRLVVSFRRAEPLPKGRGEPLSIHVDRLYYKLDGVGYLPSDRFRLYLVDVAGETAALEPLRTSDVPTEHCDWDDLAPRFSPDGTRVAFASNRRADRDFDVENRDLYVVPATGGQALQCTHSRGSLHGFAWSPDGSFLAASACVAPIGEVLARENVHLYRVAVDGSEPEVDLTPDLDRCVLNLTLCDLFGLESIDHPPAFARDGRTLYTVVSDRGTTWLGALPLDGAGFSAGALERVVDDRVVMFFSVADEFLALITSSETEPGRIERMTLDGRARELVCWPMEEYCAEVALMRSDELRIATAEGHDVQAWLLLPESAESRPAAGWPLLLWIHGGPFVQLGRACLHEAQVLAARGHAVLMVNPRGSQGYGRAFVSPIRQDWGEPAYRDLMAAVDHVLAQQPIDSARMGVLGGSYGGYMTLWIIGHTRRFKAACTQRTVSLVDALSWSDFGAWIEVEMGAAPHDDPELYRRLSPLTYMRDVDTPLLIMQGTADLRTPTDQGERLYVTMRRMGKDVEMVLFPGGNHDLSRHGSPAQRIERLRILCEWFERRLGVE